MTADNTQIEYCMKPDLCSLLYIVLKKIIGIGSFYLKQVTH